jgi:hypothetical protein
MSATDVYTRALEASEAAKRAAKAAQDKRIAKALAESIAGERSGSLVKSLPGLLMVRRVL